MEQEVEGPGGYIPNVLSVEVIGDYALRLKFDDGLVRELDLRDRLRGAVFEPLRDPRYFAKVSVDRQLGTVVWPNGADFSPEFLHGDFEPEPRER